MKKKKLFSAVFFLFFFVILILQIMHAQDRVKIIGIKFDFNSRQKLAPGSDNWPITWATDENGNDVQYTTWGDGGGFRGTNSDGRVSLGVARIEGDYDNYKGYNVWGGKDPENPETFEGKSYGIISIDGTLYMWVSPGSGSTNFNKARLAVSNDHAKTWTQLDWAFTKEDEIVLPTFLQFGKDYDNSRDDYVYIYAARFENSDSYMVGKKIDLMRVPKDKITDRNSHEFFTGFKNGKPAWTTDINKKRIPVFADCRGVGPHLSVSYNPGLKKYILMTQHTEFAKGNLGVYAADEPWGPFIKISDYENWLGLGANFFWDFANKWLSVDGTKFVMIFTGINDDINKNDAWNTIKGRFIVSKTPDD